MLIELYETEFGIYDHVQGNSIFGSVKFTNSKNYRKNFFFTQHLKNYLFNDVYKHTGLSFDDYLNRPRYEIEEILTTLKYVNDEKDKEKKRILDNLKNEQPPPNQQPK